MHMHKLRIKPDHRTPIFDGAYSDRFPIIARFGICCFRYVPDQGHDADDLNQRLFRRLMRETDFMPSSTLVGGSFAIRPCFINARTTMTDVDAFMDAVVALGRELTAPSDRGPVTR